MSLSKRNENIQHLTDSLDKAGKLSPMDETGCIDLCNVGQEAGHGLLLIIHFDLHHPTRWHSRDELFAEDEAIDIIPSQGDLTDQ